MTALQQPQVEPQSQSATDCPAPQSLQTVQTSTLEIAYFCHGSDTGWPVVLTHGFPYDIHAYDVVHPHLTKAGARVIIPYVRGFGPTRFLSSKTMRSGQQAALGLDLIGLLDGLGIQRAIVAGFDWGGVASCTASILFPERVEGLVSYAGYDVIDIAGQRAPCHPELERVMWYQHLLQSERGRRCLADHTQDFCEGLWRQWSPCWKFTKADFDATAVSFGNLDFVDVVTHAYRFCFGNEIGDPSLEEFEERLAKKPQIQVPAITLDGSEDPLKPGGTAYHKNMFAARYEHRRVRCGHNLPQEAPEAMADAILTVRSWLMEKNM